MDFQHIGFTHAEGVYRLTLQNEKRLNSLSGEMLLEMAGALNTIEADDDAKALIITGAGRGFCSGANLASGDMSEIAAPTPGEMAANWLERYGNPVIEQLLKLRIPTIAAVNGVTAGGGVGLALSCDIVIAAESASFVLVFAPKLGLVPDLGSSVLAPLALGRARALGYALTGDPIPARQAEEIGLIWKCVDDAALHDTVDEIAKTLAAGSADAFSKTRQVMDAGLRNLMSEQLKLETDLQRDLANSPFFLQALAAFNK